MKIIHISPSYKPAYIYGGTTFSVSRLCEELVIEKIAILVMTTTANGKSELKIPRKTLISMDNVDVQYFKRITKDHTHFSPSLLWNLYTMENTRLIHIHSWWNLTAILACCIAKAKDIPVVLSPRGTLTTYSLNNRKKLVKAIIHKTIGKKLIAYTHVHATTLQEKLDILAIQKPASITVIPNFINLPAAITTPDGNYRRGEDRSTFKLIFLSRIEEKKGIDILFSALSKTRIPWQLTIAGSGEDKYVRKLKKAAIKLGIAASISWIGQVNPIEKYGHLARHDLLVLFSHNESFANVVIESLLVGTPVAISNQVGLSPFVRLHNLGWTANLCAAAISKLITNASQEYKKRKQIRLNAPAIVSKHFQRQILIQQYLELYKNVE